MIEAQIRGEIYSKTTNNSKFERSKIPNESLHHEMHFKNVYVGYWVGWEFEKYGSKLRTFEPRPTFAGSYK